jgi:hypothetical protein
VPEVIATLRQKIDTESPGAAAEFTDKLMRTGYLDADAEIYGATRTVLSGTQGFRVAGDFPRLRTAATIIASTFVHLVGQPRGHATKSDSLPAVLTKSCLAVQTLLDG